MRASSGGPIGRRGTGCRTWQCAVQPTGPVVFAQLGLTSRAAWPARTPLPRARQARSSSHPRSLGALRHRRGRRTRAVPPSRERHSVPPAWAASVTGHPRRTIRSSEAESGRERPQSQPAGTSVCTEATTGETSRRLRAPGSSSCVEDVGAQHVLFAGEYGRDSWSSACWKNTAVPVRGATTTVLEPKCRAAMMRFDFDRARRVGSGGGRLPACDRSFACHPEISTPSVRCRPSFTRSRTSCSSIASRLSRA